METFIMAIQAFGILVFAALVIECLKMLFKMMSK